MDQLKENNSHNYNLLEVVFKKALAKASSIFSKTLKVEAYFEIYGIHEHKISTLADILYQDNQEVIGVMVDLVGEYKFKFLFMSGIENSKNFTDRILKRELGTTKNLDLYCTSTIQELGNLLSSSISNALVNIFDMKITPSPPMVACDYSATIFQEYIMDLALQKDTIIILETKLNIEKTETKCPMYLLPINVPTKNFMKKHWEKKNEKNIDR
ncbi:MAG: chemotaxis protein CheC [Oligoflexia bacterium]|nr:chemotaxis protein CheC [Oligoflexia bacterium]